MTRATQEEKEDVGSPSKKLPRALEHQYLASQLAVYEAAMTWSTFATNPVTTSEKSRYGMASAVLQRLCKEHGMLRASWIKKGVMLK